MAVSDALSRAYLKDQKPEISDAEMNHMIHSVISSLPISDEKLKHFQIETSKDETLRTLHNYVMNGWPKNKNDINPAVMPYFGTLQFAINDYTITIKEKHDHGLDRELQK